MGLIFLVLAFLFVCKDNNVTKQLLKSWMTQINDEVLATVPPHNEFSILRVDEVSAFISLLHTPLPQPSTRLTAYLPIFSPIWSL